MKRGHVPLRKCIACGTVAPAHELMRFKLTAGNVAPAYNSRLTDGRGCYLCRRKECIEIAFKRGRFARSFRRTGLQLPGKEALLNRLETEGVVDDHVDR
jgi:predicted RNA-binding protein YlxR (DUF448 family)